MAATSSTAGLCNIRGFRHLTCGNFLLCFDSFTEVDSLKGPAKPSNCATEEPRYHAASAMQQAETLQLLSSVSVRSAIFEIARRSLRPVLRRSRRRRNPQASDECEETHLVLKGVALPTVIPLTFPLATSTSVLSLLRMTEMTMSRPPFDQNDRKYVCLCGQLHIRTGSRVVAVLLNVLTAINIIFSFTRTSTVAMYTLMGSAFAVVVFGCLLYGVYKEKRLYLVPYLIFQIISIGITILLLFAFTIGIAMNSKMVIDLAEDLGNIDTRQPQKQLDAELASFTAFFILALCISGILQAYFFEVIYSFYGFLRDRESSFNFNFEGSPTTQIPDAGFGIAGGVPPSY
ncbi:hypothetical protein KIN20_034297 [Parelaphostrongylus tenuis]|uniref:Uncharacterized protein n=1 Tax=Parelaphostrongylus tenuis TaxID=148309 RepID=A0AAD5R9V0_PARTN|nr:hypothetical protein KIN20_034297 [Parelaphostrongylus tenuis]